MEAFQEAADESFVRHSRMFLSDLPWKLPLASMDLKRENPWKCVRRIFPICESFRESSSGSYFHEIFRGNFFFGSVASM